MNSALDWIGDLPSGWRRLPLKRIASVANSGLFGDEEPSLARPIPLLACTTAHIDPHNGFRVGQMETRYFSEQERSQYVGRKGDIFVVKSSGSNTNVITGKRAQVEDQSDIVFTNFLLRVRPCEGTHPRFLFYLLGSSLVHERIKREVATTTYPNLNLHQYLSEPLPLPEFGIQKAIAAFLDVEVAQIDELIEKKQRMVELLATKKKTEAASLVRRGLDTNAVLQETDDQRFGLVPTHWRLARLKHLFRQVKRQNYPDLDVLSVYRDFGVILKDSRDDNINKTPEDLRLYQLVQPGDLVVNKMKAWQGSLGISEYCGITSPDYVVFTPTNTQHPRFIHHYLRAQPLPAIYMTISNGIRPDQWRLEPQKFRDIPVWLPSVEEQEAIARRIDAAALALDRVTLQTQVSIEKLGELRSALITATVTGKVDVTRRLNRRSSALQRLDVLTTEAVQ